MLGNNDDLASLQQDIELNPNPSANVGFLDNAGLGALHSFLANNRNIPFSNGLGAQVIRALQEGKEIDLLIKKEEYTAAIEVALKAQKQGRYDSLWMVAETFYENIGEPDISQIFHCYELISAESPYYIMARTRMAELRQLIEPAEEKIFSLDDHSSSTDKERREETLRYALEALPHPRAQEIANHTFHAMQEKMGQPDALITGDLSTAQAAVLLISEQQAEVQRLENRISIQQAEIQRLKDRISMLEASQSTDVNCEKERTSPTPRFFGS